MCVLYVYAQFLNMVHMLFTLHTHTKHTYTSQAAGLLIADKTNRTGEIQKKILI